MDESQLLHDLIRPALKVLGDRFYTDSSSILLLATSAQETWCGKYIKQLYGPALGIYQMEPFTYNDTIQRNNEHLPDAPHEADRMVYDFRYATQMARLKYWLDSEPLPAFDDENGMWKYYKRVWNTSLGDATKEEFHDNWNEHVVRVLDSL